jgi:aminopeptidase N
MQTIKLITAFTAILISCTGLLGQVTPGDTIHAVKYVIELEEVDIENHTISANTNVTLAPLVNNLEIIQLQLMELTVDSVFVDMQKTMDFTHANEVITIQLQSPVSIGDTMDVRIYYQGEPFHENWGGFHYDNGYAFNLGVGIDWIPHNLGKSWFPCIDDFTDRASYEVAARVPDTLTAVGGGELIDYTDHGDGTHTFRYYIDNPIPTYLVSIAVGEYAVVEDIFPGEERDIPVTYWVHPSDTQHVTGTFARVYEVMDLFEDKFGPYDWYRIGYITTSDYGAMEHASNIAIPNYFVNGNLANESTIMHELSHMWFGDKVTCDKAEEMWINEGWATFCQHYYVEALDGLDLYKSAMRAKHLNVLLTCHKVENGWHPMNNIPQEYTYGLSAYHRGATKVQALRGYLGDDVFFPACEAYLEDYAFQSVSSYDMEASFTQNTGIDMSGFFNNYIYHGGTPAYTLDSFNVMPNGGDWDVSIYVKQRRYGPPFMGDGNRIGFSVLAQNLQRYDDFVHFDGESGSKTITVPFEPAEVFLDLEERYMDATVDNYLTIAGTGEYTFPKTSSKVDVDQLTDSVFIQLTHILTTPDTFEIPVPGLKLSDKHFWSVRGILEDGFAGRCGFSYSFMGFENGLITGPEDTLSLFYRSNAGMPWEEVDANIEGAWSGGYLFADELQIGDYVFGIWNDPVSNEEHINTSLSDPLKVYPNPSYGEFTFEVNAEQAFRIDVYKPDGQLINSIDVMNNESRVSWTPSHLPAGIYIAILRDTYGRIIESIKLVFTK